MILWGHFHIMRYYCHIMKSRLSSEDIYFCRFYYIMPQLLVVSFEVFFYLHCVKCVQMRTRKKLHIWTLFTQCWYLTLFQWFNASTLQCFKFINHRDAIFMEKSHMLEKQARPDFQFTFGWPIKLSIPLSSVGFICNKSVETIVSRNIILLIRLKSHLATNILVGVTAELQFGWYYDRKAICHIYPIHSYFFIDYFIDLSLINIIFEGVYEYFVMTVSKHVEYSKFEIPLSVLITLSLLEFVWKICKWL